MSAESRRAEAERVSTVFHAALTQIGVQTLAEALDLWDEVPPAGSPRAASSWLGKAAQLVTFQRARSRRLARSYYRLVRALYTDRTIRFPDDPQPTYVRLGDLRDEFDSLAREAGVREPEASTPATPTETAPDPSEAPSEAHSADDDIDLILSEEIKAIEEEERRVEAEAEQELQTALAALGRDNLARQVEEIGDDLPAGEADRLRDEAHQSAGARQASAAERVAMNGARSELWSLTSRDPRAIGYIRLSRTGTPCGWCAMLISRGPVYSTEAAATYAEGDLYHDNCHCYAEPVFSREQYDSSALYALNRQYADEWPEVTKGLQGKAAVSAWRAYIRRQQKTQRAQVARPTPSVQEA